MKPGSATREFTGLPAPNMQHRKIRLPQWFAYVRFIPVACFGAAARLSRPWEETAVSARRKKAVKQTSLARQSPISCTRAGRIAIRQRFASPTVSHVRIGRRSTFRGNGSSLARQFNVSETYEICQTAINWQLLPSNNSSFGAAMSVTETHSALEPIHPLETELLVRLNEGGPAISIGTDDSCLDSTVRASFLRWFLLNYCHGKPELSRLVLIRVALDGALDLRGAALGIALSFVECRLAFLDATDSKLRSIEFLGGMLGSISADRAFIDGSMRFVSRRIAQRSGAKQIVLGPLANPTLDAIRLCGATVRGNLDFRGCRMGPEFGNFGQSRPLFADGAVINGNVLLSKGFRCRGEVCLNGSLISRNLDCTGATLVNPIGYSISAAGTTINGHVLMCRQYWGDDDPTQTQDMIFCSVGAIRLEGCKIGGNLDLRHSRLTASAFVFDQRQPHSSENEDLYAIRADGIQIGADLLFGSDEDARKSAIPEAFAFFETLTLDRLGSRFDILGAVSLINGKIAGDFLLCNTTLHFPGEETVCADAITVSGHTFMDNTYSNGVIRLLQADLKQGLSLSGAKFDTTWKCRHWFLEEPNSSEESLGIPACGIYASYCRIGISFTWQGIEKIAAANDGIAFVLDLSGSVISALRDDKPSWFAVDRLYVSNAVISLIDELKPSECVWRTKILDQHYARLNAYHVPDLFLLAHRLLAKPALKLFRRAGRRAEVAEPKVEIARKKAGIQNAIEAFQPQPYLQLARLFRAAGYQSAATAILVRLERNETRYGDVSALKTVWRWLLDIGIKYGHSPGRPIFYLFLAAVFSAWRFDLAYTAGQIVPAKDSTAAQSRTMRPPVPSFNPTVYSLDTLLPIVDLNQKKNWAVEPLSSPVGSHKPENDRWAFFDYFPHSGPGLLLVINTFFGWLMTTLFVVGVTGLMRPNKES